MSFFFHGFRFEIFHHVMVFEFCMPWKKRCYQCDECDSLVHKMRIVKCFNFHHTKAIAHSECSCYIKNNFKNQRCTPWKKRCYWCLIFHFHHTKAIAHSLPSLVMQLGFMYFRDFLSVKDHGSSSGIVRFLIFWQHCVGRAVQLYTYAACSSSSLSHMLPFAVAMSRLCLASRALTFSL